MYNVTKYPHGTFSWADNNSTDPEAAKAFYQRLLFGWDKDWRFPIGPRSRRARPTPCFRIRTALSCGRAGWHDARYASAAGVPSHWNELRFTVNDVDALVEVVTANGGSILYLDLCDVFDSGRMMQILGPDGRGARLCGRRRITSALASSTPSARCAGTSCSPRTPKPRKAFYSRAVRLGIPSVDENGYIMIQNRGRNNGAMMQMDESFGGMPSMWQPYFTVADVSTPPIEQAQANCGADDHHSLRLKRSWRWLLRLSVTIPAGAHFYIIQLIQSEPWQE